MHKFHINRNFYYLYSAEILYYKPKTHKSNMSNRVKKNNKCYFIVD